MPFCLDKCHYCNFVSFTDKINEIELYINSLIDEIRHELDTNPDVELKSVYIGGGTPSLVDTKYYDLIFSTIKEFSNIAKDPEITIEVNPGTINPEYLKTLKNLGINRISIGIQSFDNDILKMLNRKHTKIDAVKAVEMAQECGFTNISIDLIYGLPGQDLKMWEETLNTAVKLDIQHISVYGLKIEEGTKFAKKLPFDLPEEEVSAQMYLKNIDILVNNGFEHYEISNFAKPGYKSRHNLNYWHNNEYFGFGLSTHGYVNGIRYSNTDNFEKYLNNPLKKATCHNISNSEIIEEGIFLGLRLINGININKFRNEYKINLLEKYKDIIDKYINYGYMQISGEYLRLTTDGILISNIILADFLQP